MPAVHAMTTRPMPILEPVERPEEASWGLETALRVLFPFEADAEFVVGAAVDPVLKLVVGLAVVLVAWSRRYVVRLEPD